MSSIDLNTLLEASQRVMFGTSRFGSVMSKQSGGDSRKLLEACLSGGVSAIDTADLYGQGSSESVIGSLDPQLRDQITIATKGGYKLSQKVRWLSRFKPVIKKILKSSKGLQKKAQAARGSQISQDFSESYLSNALEASLRRLKTDRVELYQLHSPSVNVLKQGDVFQTLDVMKAQGKILSSGVSLLSWDHLEHCLGRQLDCIQLDARTLVPPVARQLEALKALKKEGVILIARQPFASGLLTTPPTQWSLGQFQGEQDQLEHAKETVSSLSRFQNPHEIILRYLIHHSVFDAVLFATTSPTHLKGNLDSIGAGNLNGEDQAVMRSLFPFLSK